MIDAHRDALTMQERNVATRFENGFIVGQDSNAHPSFAAADERVPDVVMRDRENADICSFSRPAQTLDDRLRAASSRFK